MNNRIFELAKQADLIQWDSLPSGARTPDHESVGKARKFAELIVRECCQFENSYSGDARLVSRHYGRRIREHFGVEE